MVVSHQSPFFSNPAWAYSHLKQCTRIETANRSETLKQMTSPGPQIVLQICLLPPPFKKINGLGEFSLVKGSSFGSIPEATAGNSTPSLKLDRSKPCKGPVDHVSQHLACCGLLNTRGKHTLAVVVYSMPWSPQKTGDIAHKKGGRPIFGG